MTIAETSPGPREASTPGEIVLGLRGLEKHFPIRAGLFGQVKNYVRAVVARPRWVGVSPG